MTISFSPGYGFFDMVNHATSVGDIVYGPNEQHRIPFTGDFGRFGHGRCLFNVLRNILGNNPE
jgi:hypothetical protein